MDAQLILAAEETISGNINAVGYGLAAIGPGVGIGLIFAAYINGVARQPEAQSRLQSIAILGFDYRVSELAMMMSRPEWLHEVSWLSVVCGLFVAFLVVSIAVMVLRRREPDLPRTFRVPLYPITPILSALGCLWIIKDLRPITLLIFVGWVALALIWYFSYGIKHSTLGRHRAAGLLANPDTSTDPKD